MKKISIKEFELSYTDIGSGEPILFIHNGMSSGIIWDYQKKFFLKNNYRVIIPDLIGFGESSKTVHDLSLDFYVEIMDEFLKKLGLKKVHLVGICIGANICLRLIKEKNYICKSPVLINPFPGDLILNNSLSKYIFNSFVNISILKRFLIKSYCFFYSHSDNLKLLPLRFVFSDPKKELNSQNGLLNHLKNIYLRNDSIKSRVNLILNMQSYTFKPDYKNRYDKIIPFFIWGEKNKAINIDFRFLIKPFFKFYKEEVIDNSGHFLMIEKSKRVNQLILSNIKLN